MAFDFFIDYRDFHVYSSIVPGRRPGDPNVTDIRALKYSPEGVIYYKTDFNDSYKLLSQRTKRIDFSSVKYKRLYSERLKIKKSKYDHLQQLKPLLPRDGWDFYDNLPYS